ncbi:glutathione S-transferase family protein [Cysteiniphilum halobium]|uniref:glutathione S-transferase family protein n=1 Tax=Cysteiniphilum halobium TaxID=2219059 RepID=UPI0013C33EEA|nr:glutathione S-transferase family protein [Cysteiniphilum halobium]
MIELHQFPKLGDLPNASPFCMKLESYLIAQKADYKNFYGADLKRSPTGKMPYIKKQGKFYSDSSLIIDLLENESMAPMQQSLTAVEKSQTLAYQRLCEEHLYWVLVYSRWVDVGADNAWRKIVQEGIKLPRFLVGLIFKVMTKNATKQVHEQGLGRLTKAQIYQKADEDLLALSEFLGTKTYFFNASPSLLDHIVYSVIANIDHTPWQSQLKQQLTNYPNLQAHSTRMLKQFFA